MSRGFFRKISFNKMVGAWKSQWKRALKRFFMPWYGKKGTGWWTNPRKALYNWWYHRTSMSVFDLFGRRHKHQSCSKGFALFLGVVGWLFLPVACLAAVMDVSVSKVKKPYSDHKKKKTNAKTGKATNSSARKTVLKQEARIKLNGQVSVEKRALQVKENYVASQSDTLERDGKDVILDEPLQEIETQEILHSGENKKLTLEEMKAYKLSVLKDGEEDVNAVVEDESKPLSVLWNENIDRFFSDCVTQLQEGKLLKDSVKDLVISKGRITADVLGNRVVPYKVIITIEPMAMEKGQKVNQAEIEDLFPTKKDFWLFCNCGEEICEHMMAVLYAAGRVFDENCERFFCLRGVN